jgi:hypothetical protein
MKRKIFLLLYLTVFALGQSVPGQSPPQSSPERASGSAAQVEALAQQTSEDETSLDFVIRAVKNALQKYQDNLGGGADALPPLQEAEFDFKVATAQSVGGSINLFIIKFGASVENSTTNDVAYTYSVPAPSEKVAKAKGSPPSLDDTLAQTIQEAAKAVKKSAMLNNLKFNKLVVTVQYGVKWVGNGGITGTYSFITIGVNAEKNKSSVHSVKLTFRAPEKPKKP